MDGERAPCQHQLTLLTNLSGQLIEHTRSDLSSLWASSSRGRNGIYELCLHQLYLGPHHLTQRFPLFARLFLVSDSHIPSKQNHPVPVFQLQLAKEA